MKCVQFRSDRQFLHAAALSSFRLSYGCVPIAYSRRMEPISVTSSGHLARRRTEASKDGLATMPAMHASVRPAGVPPGAAAAGLRDQIETWVGKGGAGDHVAP